MARIVRAIFGRSDAPLAARWAFAASRYAKMPVGGTGILLAPNGTRPVGTHACSPTRALKMAWMHCSLHGQQYQSCQLLIHWSVRLVVLHMQHLGPSSGADLLTVCRLP